MWYVLPDSNKQYPLTLERVTKIRSLNHQNIIPEELEAVDVTSSKPKEVEPEFVDVVGHITLKSLEKADKKRHQKGREQRPPQQKQLPPRGNQQMQARPNQQKGTQQQPQQKPNQPRPNPPQKGNQQKPPQQRRPGNNNPDQKK